jgi:hypothetical protein
MEKVCPICGTPREKPSEEIIERPIPSEEYMVDGLLWKDYYTLRDLRLLLWGLEKELYEKYGISEASDLGRKVRGLISEKIREIESRLGSHSHSSLDLCGLLKEAASALYYVSEVKPEGVAYEKYEELSLKVLDAMKALGCPEAERLS